MSNRSKLNPTQIIQMTYDEDINANRVKLVDTEISMELNHADGDSVTTHPSKLTASVLGVINPDDNNVDIIPAIDCSSLRQVRVDINGTGEVSVMASPNDSGNYFYVIGGAGVEHNICARRLKVKSFGAHGDVHLVGRS